MFLSINLWLSEKYVSVYTLLGWAPFSESESESFFVFFSAIYLNRFRTLGNCCSTLCKHNTNTSKHAISKIQLYKQINIGLNIYISSFRLVQNQMGAKNTTLGHVTEREQVVGTVVVLLFVSPTSEAEKLFLCQFGWSTSSMWLWEDCQTKSRKEFGGASQVGLSWSHSQVSPCTDRSYTWAGNTGFTPEPKTMSKASYLV